jgi:hypothetical protein
MPVLWNSSHSMIFYFYTLYRCGSTVTIRHVNTQGGYLHSHPHNYHGGSHNVCNLRFLSISFLIEQQIIFNLHWDSSDGSPSFYDWKNKPLVYIKVLTRIKLRRKSIYTCMTIVLLSQMSTSRMKFRHMVWRDFLVTPMMTGSILRISVTVNRGNT